MNGEALVLHNMLALMAAREGGRPVVTVEYDYLNPAENGDDDTRPNVRTVTVTNVRETKDGHLILVGKDAYRGGAVRTYRLDRVRVVVDVDVEQPQPTQPTEQIPLPAEPSVPF